MDIVVACLEGMEMSLDSTARVDLTIEFQLHPSISRTKAGKIDNHISMLEVLCHSSMNLSTTITDPQIESS